MDNNQEWRALFLDELKEIRKEIKEVRTDLSSFKLKITGMTSLIGSIISIAWNKFLN